jgi:sterol desaturase/sphingolipid hydroxylase (fatty acid hydroxylase superfamily)
MSTTTTTIINTDNNNNNVLLLLLLSTLTSITNPLHLTLFEWLALCLLKSIAEFFLDTIVSFILEFINQPKLASRLNPEKSKGLEALRKIDYFFLFLNTFIETTFVMNLFHYVLFEAPTSMNELTMLNSVGAIYLCFLIDDAIYYVGHRTLHLPFIYPYVHKHHHINPYPKRGYWDAANENPIEQVIGLGCVWISLQICAATVGFHGIAAIAFFAIYATLAIINHMPYDVRFGIFGLGYSAAAHESHHVLLRGNYAQNTMVFDQMLGTFLPYKG